MNQVFIVAGGAGFVGTNLIPQLLGEGATVVVADNFSRGQRDTLPQSERLQVLQADLADRASTEYVFEQATSWGSICEVWHLAANSDIPAGVEDCDVDFKDTFRTTFELLRAMKSHGVKHFHFASSSAVYGDLGSQALHESIGPLLPISNYGAMKLASEAQASAAAESYLERVNLFRFPNVVGIPATHGVILDFINKLAKTQDKLEVLGDGSQQKAYLHVSDLVRAMLMVRSRTSANKVELVNIGPTDDGVTVRWIAEQVVARVAPAASIGYGSGNKGWVGDVPKFKYLTDRMQTYGWTPTMGSAEAVVRAIDEIARQLGR
jgi:UDP-glucose 4-epimerase